MIRSLAVPGVSLAAVLLLMGIETAMSRRNERALRQRGAVEPDGDVYGAMRWVYPAAFAGMAAEGALTGAPSAAATAAGAVLLAGSKALKFWAIGALGARWTFRVLVLRGEPLVTSGPYALMRHPNYVAVVGELVSMALLVGARVTGPAAVLCFGLLLRRRIHVEDRALRHPPCSSPP